MAASRAGLAPEHDPNRRGQRHRHVVGPPGIRLDTAAAVLPVCVRAERAGKLARDSERTLSPPPDGEPPRHPSRHRRRGGPDVHIDRRADLRAVRAGAAGSRGPARVARCHSRSRQSPRRFEGVDLWQPDPDGPRMAVVHHGAHRVDPRPACGDSEGRAVVAIPSPRPPPEGTRAGGRAPIQPANARERHPVRADAAHACETPWHAASTQDSPCDRVEPPARHGRLWHRQVRVDSSDPPAARGARRDGHRVRPGPGIHTAVLHARTRRRNPESHRRPLAVLESWRRAPSRGRGAHTRDVALSRSGQRESVLHRRAAAHLCAPAHFPPERRGTDLLVVSRRGA
jgi:hypothetical protein